MSSVRRAEPQDWHCFVCPVLLYIAPDFYPQCTRGTALAGGSVNLSHVLFVFKNLCIGMFGGELCRDYQFYMLELCYSTYYSNPRSQRNNHVLQACLGIHACSMLLSKTQRWTLGSSSFLSEASHDKAHDLGPRCWRDRNKRRETRLYVSTTTCLGPCLDLVQASQRKGKKNKKGLACVSLVGWHVVAPFLRYLRVEYFIILFWWCSSSQAPA